MLTSLILLVIFSAVALFCIGLVTLSKHLKWETRLYFAVAIFSLILWQVALFFSNVTTPFVLFFNRLVYVGPMFALVFFGLFLDAAFLKQSIQRPGLHKLGFAIAILGSVAALTPFNVDQVTPRYEGTAVSGYNIIPGSLSLLVAACLVALACLLVARFVIVHQHIEARSRLPLRIVQRAAIAATVVSIITNVFAPILIGGSYLAILINNAMLLGLVAILVLTVLKYKFLDIRLIVIRAIAYLTTLFATTLLLILPVVLLFSSVLGEVPEPRTLTLIVIAGGIALYIIQYLRGVFDKITNKIFFRHYYDLQDVLDRLGTVLVQTTDIDSLQNTTREIISQALRPRFLEFVLFASENANHRQFAANIKKHARTNIVAADELEANTRLSSVLASHEVALALELRANTKELGYLVLGYKQSGDAYSTEDIRLMSIAADEVAIALQNALRFEEIERFSETLQQKVEDATRKLRESNQKLKQLNDSKDDFIGMASHQLRTPLTSIKGYVSLVMDGDAGKVTATQRKLLMQAFSSSQKMVYLIADLLNVSRLKTGKFTIERKPTNLIKLVRDELDQLDEEVKLRGLELTFEPPDKLPMLPLDETKTRQVVMNFLDNAIYYTKAGGHIKAQLRELPKSIEFRVIDDGIGVPRAERHQLFTKFYRAKNAQRARPDGTGLGLYMARKVITAQGGAIIFDSVEGKGSTFGFTFPKDLPAESVALPALTKD